MGDARQGVWAGVWERGLWVPPEPALLRLQDAAAWGAGLRLPPFLLAAVAVLEERGKGEKFSLSFLHPLSQA